MNATQAKRERTKLRRTRETRVFNERCGRCGGRGGSDAWKFTGWTCYRCGGHGREMVERRVYADPAAQARDDELTAIIEAERQAKAQAAWEAGRAERERKEREDAHEDALVEDAERDAAARHQYLDAKRGDRLELPVRVEFAKAIETFYGNSMLVVFRDEAGNAIKTFGTGMDLWGLSSGDRVTVRGTVKDFDEYQGEKQTVLNRVKVTKEAVS